MVRVRQHGGGGTLFDMPVFLPILERYLQPEGWLVDVEWCTGESGPALEALPPQEIVPHAGFVSLLAGLRQTIDGTYRCLRSGQVVAELQAVDSSFWQVVGPEEFEAELLALCGPG